MSKCYASSYSLHRTIKANQAIERYNNTRQRSTITTVGSFGSRNLFALLSQQLGISTQYPYSWLLVFFLFVGGLSSCQNDMLEPTQLSISPDTELLLPAVGGEHIFSITTNQNSYDALCNRDWVKLRQAGHKLIVEAEPNLTSQGRTAEIVVIAGSKQIQLSIKQEFATEGVIKLKPSGELRTDRLRKDYRVIVTTNSTQWRARLEGDEQTWLKILPRSRYGEIILSFEENKTRSTRSIKLIIEEGNAKSELLIQQEGIPHFFLPYLVWESDLESAETFETQRNSRITLRPRPGDPVQGVRAVPYFQFSTISSAFQQVRYEYLNMGTRFLYKATLVAQNLSITEGQELLDFLQKEGYKLRTDLKSNETSKFYIHENAKIHLQYTIDKEAREAYLIFTPLVEQQGDYLIPQDLPLGFPLKKNSSKAEVEAWEKQMKSEKAEGITQALGLPAYFALEPYFLRYYLYTEQDANTLHSVFVTLDPKYQGLYRYGGLLFVTREFDKLIKDKGFIYEAYDQRAGVHYYTNSNENLRLAVGLMRIANLELTRIQVSLLK